ncbi:MULTISPECIES: hypothetical protein [unclassified Pseudomonas]|uniref:hypothetical protein n=1 Tax=unclassified Pseudomonas TaxID=196821 RepID=UPI002304EDEF|nr:MULTISPECIES: hypothetical protein [unclassified Pseudomonas]MDU9414930.1 hypothetical protein [Pseudomonas sp. zfem005]WCD81762.1 hypothetical protein PI990_07035 [Pseudomonas sp. TUM22785]
MTIRTKLCLTLLTCALGAAYISLLQSPLLTPLAGVNPCQAQIHACYRPALRF